MLRFIILAGLIALILFYMFGRWFTRTPPAQVAQIFRKLVTYGVAAILILLAVTGRLNWIFGLLGGVIPLLQRLMVVQRTVNYFRQQHRPASSAQSSCIKTRFLNMSLDHDTGVMTGVVNEGRFKGRELTDLDLSQLIELLGECRSAADTDSVAVLEAYLDRHHGDWRNCTTEDQNQHRTVENSAMSREEAYQILGLTSAAGEADIKEAHRRLMQKLHPDRGGSTYLAAKINKAKDILLGHV